MANPKTQPKPIGPGSNEQEGYSGPSFDLGQLAGNPTAISPDYTSDPTQAGSALQIMKQELAYAQANPNDPNSSYIISTLTPAITEQQNIVNYDQAQAGQNKLAGSLNAQNTVNQINQSGDANQIVQLAQSLGGMGYGSDQLAQAVAEMKSYGYSQGLDGSAIDQVMKDMVNSWASGTQPQMNMAKFTPAVANSIMGLFNSIPSNQLPQMLNAYNQGQTTLANGQNAIVNGLTYAQPNYAGLSNQITNTFGGPNGGNPTGLYGSTLTPQLQDIYSVAYNNKMGTTAQLQGMGLGSSGAMNQAKQTQDTNALNKSLSALSNFNNTEAGLQTALKNQQQQQQAQYQTAIEAAKGNILGGNLAGAAGNLGQASGNNINAQTQTALNNAATQLGNQQMQDTTMNNLFNNIGSLAGTWAGNTNWFGTPQPSPGTI